MPAFVRNSLLGASLLLAASAAHADTDGLTLPSPPHGPGGEDSIETPSGTRCRQSINSSGAYLDVGAVGVANQPLERDERDTFRLYSDERDQKGMAYVRLTVPLGRKPTRIDCSRVYEMEIARLQAELELARMAVE